MSLRSSVLWIAMAAMVGCAEPSAPTEAPAVAAPADPNVVLAAKVAKEIAANPADPDAVLAQNHLDAATLDALMYEIAADPVKSKAYAALRK